MNRRIAGFHLPAVILLAIIVAGCGTGKKVLQVYSPTPEEIISSHLTLGEPVTLINDLESYPEFKDRIENALYRHIDYGKYDYEALKQFSLVAQDDYSAAVFFDSLLVDRQESILSRLSEEDLDVVGEYYRNNVQQHDFLYNALKEAYFEEIDSLEYYGLRSLHKAFEGTDLDKLVYSRYSDVRNEILKGIMEELTPYFDAEQELLEAIDSQLREDLEKYIEKGVVQVASELSERVDRGFFKRTFQRKDIDNYSITEYAELLVSRYIDKDYISDLIYKRMGNYVRETTLVRKAYLQHYREDATKNDEYYITGVLSDDTPYNLSVSNSMASEIQNLKTKNEATTFISFALAFTPIGWPAFLLDAYDFYNGMTEGSKVETMMNQMSESLYLGYTNQIDVYLHKVYTTIDNAREVSKDFIIEDFYENF